MHQDFAGWIALLADLNSIAPELVVLVLWILSKRPTKRD